MEGNNIFVDGMFFDKPSAGAPDFVKGKISVKVETLVPFLEEHKNDKGYVNIDLKKSTGGKLYLSLNNFKKEGDAEVADEGPTEQEVKDAGIEADEIFGATAGGK